ncbi:MAG: HmuY family protein [Bacteroidales bacterium]|nr:HmuY family protein [Bacteroidales bacterium]MCM1147732.1 HmuY family protein [Bacteroidales bacterium]MCM1206658.1 HmuY family protein [Bacillota bacterium]MCM1510601.1 HmuY family protein [Clostridium sp.]
MFKTLSFYFLSIILPAMLMSGCEGAFDFVYDDPPVIQPVQGQVYIDASSWTKWHYLDLIAASDKSREDEEYDASGAFVTYDIPMDAAGDSETETGQQRPGQYQYWYDVWGEGLSKNEFRKFTPCDAQPEPDSWTFAIHRDNVRTNPEVVAGVWESPMTDISAINSSQFADAVFTADEWSENEVWSDQSQMLNSLVSSQGIYVNEVLSGWLTMSIPPIPPAFTHNNHVFIVAMRDGTFAALQLADYISPKGTKCCLTINYKYPL